MNPLTTEQKLDNCVLALAHWATISSQSVALHTWNCGSHACFGGYVATWPEFQEQGVRRANKRDQHRYGTSIGAPVCGTRTERVDEHEVAEYLFGNATLFNVRDSYDKGGSDHAVIVERLHQQIERLSNDLRREQQKPS